MLLVLLRGTWVSRLVTGPTLELGLGLVLMVVGLSFSLAPRESTSESIVNCVC